MEDFSTDDVTGKDEDHVVRTVAESLPDLKNTFRRVRGHFFLVVVQRDTEEDETQCGRTFDLVEQNEDSIDGHNDEPLKTTTFLV